MRVLLTLPVFAAMLSAQVPDSPLVELGQRLFFDSRLSADGAVACASCHRPDHGFADPRPVSLGVGGRAGRRNAPTVLNKDRQRHFFWDGRAASLEEQVRGPLFSPLEMGNTPESLLTRLSAAGEYRELFLAAFGDSEISLERIARALAAYQRSLARRDSLWDLWLAGDTRALGPAAERGRQLFFGRARCHLCHSGPDLTSGEFVNIGTGGSHPPDPGRFEVTYRISDWRQFLIPSLREVARTPPYMHDGSLATLEEVVDFYNRGGRPSENKDYRIVPLGLSEAEKADLVAFLRALSSTAGEVPSRGSVTAAAACLPVEGLSAADQELAEALLLRLMDSEALYTVVGGIKPMSSGFVRFKVPEGAALDAVDRVRRILEAFRCGEEIFATVHRFIRTYPGQKGPSLRYYDGIVFHRTAVRRVVERHRGFFARLGVSPHSHPMEVLMAVEDAPEQERWRGYGYLYGYPEEAVEFFVEAGMREKQDKVRTPRRFVSIPTYAHDEGGLVYAIADNAEEPEQGRRLRAAAEAVLAEYRLRRARYSGEAGVRIFSLLRDWLEPCRDRLSASCPPVR